MTVQELIDVLSRAKPEQRQRQIGYRTSGRWLMVDDVLLDSVPGYEDDEEPVVELS